MRRASTYSAKSEVVKLSLFLICVSFACIYWDSLWRMDRMIYDMQSALMTHESSDDIVIIAIDEASLFELGRWPWSRRVHAKLIDKLTHHKVRGIIFDIIFSEKNLADVEGDAMLSVALRENGKVVLPVLLEQSRSEERRVGKECRSRWSPYH